MGKVPVRLKEVVYTLSPYHQHVLSGLIKDLPYKLGHKFHENWVSALTLVIPVMGTYWLVTPSIRMHLLLGLYGITSHSHPTVS